MTPDPAPLILVVEDDRTVAHVVRRRLKARGYRVIVESTKTGATARPETFDALVLDLHLPDGSGLEVARALFEATARSPVVFFSGTTDSEEQQAARLLGEFVSKASGARAVADAIDTALCKTRPATVPPSSEVRSSPRARDDSLRATGSEPGSADFSGGPTRPPRRPK